VGELLFKLYYDALLAERMACCVVHLHSSGRELKLGLKSFNYYPSPRPFTLQCGEPVGPHCL